MKFVINPWAPDAPKRNRKQRKAAKLALKRAKKDWTKFILSIGWDPADNPFPF